MKNILNKEKFSIARNWGFTIFILFICLSCNKREEQISGAVIELHPEMQNIELDIKLGIEKIVRLETSNKSLFAYTSKMIASNDLLCFFDDYQSRSIYIFDHSGNWISTLNSHGKGPGEFTYISDFLVDDKEGTIELLDLRGKKIIVYSKDGEYIKEFKPDVRCANFAKQDSLTYILYAENYENLVIGDKIVTDNLLFYNPSNGITKTEMPMTGHGSYFSISPAGVFKNYLGEIVYFTIGDHNIYKIIDGMPTVYLTLDYNDLFIDIDLMNTTRAEFLEYYNVEAPRTGQVYKLYNFLEMEDYTYLTYAQSGKFICTIFRKSNKELVYRATMEELSKLVTGSAKGIVIGAHRTGLILQLEATEVVKLASTKVYDRLSNEISGNLKKVKESDNPVLFYIDFE